MSFSVSVGDRYSAIYAEGLRVAKQLMEDDSQDVLEGVLSAVKAFNETHCSPPKGRGDVYELAYRCVKDAAKQKGDESDVKRGVLAKLSKDFVIYEEVWGTHWSGRRLRIDAVITPKDDSEWKTKSPRMGIEFKNFRGFRPSFDMKDYTKWWAQCHDYAETDFDGHGYVFVFSYNGFSHYAKRPGHETSAAFAVRFWGRVGVGEIQPADLTFVINGTNKIWSHNRGVIDGRRISMERKFGSR